MQIIYHVDTPKADQNPPHLYDVQNAGGTWRPLDNGWCFYCGATLHTLVAKDGAKHASACLQCWDATRPDRFSWRPTLTPCPQCLGNLQVRFRGRSLVPLATRCAQFEGHDHIIRPNQRQPQE